MPLLALRQWKPKEWTAETARDRLREMHALRSRFYPRPAPPAIGQYRLVPQAVAPNVFLLAPSVTRIRTVQMVTASAFGVTVEDLLGSSRLAREVRPRQVAMYICKTLFPATSMPELGRRFGGRDHTTAIHAVRKIARLIGDDPELAVTVLSLMAEVKALMSAPLAAAEQP